MWYNPITIVENKKITYWEATSSVTDTLVDLVLLLLWLLYLWAIDVAAVVAVADEGSLDCITISGNQGRRKSAGWLVFTVAATARGQPVGLWLGVVVVKPRARRGSWVQQLEKKTKMMMMDNRRVSMRRRGKTAKGDLRGGGRCT